MQRGRQRQQLPRPQSLRACLFVFFAKDFSLFSQARSCVALIAGLARDNPADLLSFFELAAGHLHDRGWNLGTKARGAVEKSAAKRRGEEGGRGAGGA